MTQFVEEEAVVPLFSSMLAVHFGWEHAILLVVILLLLFFSALISGSEVAFFSLAPSDLKKFESQSASHREKQILKFLNKSDELLSTILIANNLINIGIVIISSIFIKKTFDFGDNELLGFFIEVVVITFLILLFGEILPKVFANQNPLKFALFMVLPIKGLHFLFYPLTKVLTSTSSIFKKAVSERKSTISLSDLSYALDIAEDIEEEKILQGIVNFSSIEVKKIMKPRVDVVALEVNMQYPDVIHIINQHGYSRIPVYEKTFDNIKGVLFVKDLLPYLYEGEDFEWQKLVRKPYFVYEGKKINELLQDFKKKKIHIGIVVDEYGGVQGIVTLEDILEEIVGEINDEFDKDPVGYIKLDDDKYEFAGNVLLQDFIKLFDLDNDYFSDTYPEVDTLAGLLLEIKQEFPEKNEVLVFKDFQFAVVEISERKIEKIRVEKLNRNEN